MAAQRCWIWIWLYSTLLYIVENNNNKNTQSGFMTPLLQFLLLPQTSLSRLIKQPGLLGYCLCIWLTGLCQPFNLPSKQHDHTVVSIQAIGSNSLTFCRTVVSGLLLGLTFQLAGGLASSASIGPHHTDSRLMGLHWFLKHLKCYLLMQILQVAITGPGWP